jgi:hypothetical protein
MARDLGLSPFVVRQGLASRLWHADPADTPGIIRVAESLGGEWIDFDRSLHLADEVFTYRGLEEREVWADRSTLNIPWHFYYLHLQLADAALRGRGDRELADRLIARAERFGVTATGGSMAQEGGSDGGEASADSEVPVVPEDAENPSVPEDAENPAG